MTETDPDVATVAELAVSPSAVDHSGSRRPERFYEQRIG